MIAVLDLFSGIGGISLGLERTGGFRTVAFCEVEPFPRAVLAKHWPEVPIHEDVRELRGEMVGPVDMICGGFPCQDVSVAGKGAGIEGERSGLWREFARLVGELRPRWVLAENVGALRTRGVDRVCSDLEAEGYAVWPLLVGAWAVGAPHKRERVWIVGRRSLGYADSGPAELEPSDGLPFDAATQADRRTSELSNSDAGRRERTEHAVQAGRDEHERTTAVGLADRDGRRRGADGGGELLDGERAASGDDADGRGERPVGSPTGSGLEGQRADAGSTQEPEPRDAGALSQPEGERRAQQGRGAASGWPVGEPGYRLEGERHGRDAGAPSRHDAGSAIAGATGPRWPARPGEPQHEWEPARLAQFGVGELPHGLPGRLVRLARRANREALKALGNSVVPQVVEAVGRAILEADGLMEESATGRQEG